MQSKDGIQKEAVDRSFAEYFINFLNTQNLPGLYLGAYGTFSIESSLLLAQISVSVLYNRAETYNAGPWKPGSS